MKGMRVFDVVETKKNPRRRKNGTEKYSKQGGNPNRRKGTKGMLDRSKRKVDIKRRISTRLVHSAGRRKTKSGRKEEGQKRPERMWDAESLYPGRSRCVGLPT